MPEREPRRLDRPDGSVLEFDGRFDRVIDLPVGDEGADEAADIVDVADEKAGEIDDMGGEVAERARPGGGGVEAPGLVVVSPQSWR